LLLKLKEQWREMVFWPKLSHRVGKESNDRHFAFSEKLSEIGLNLTHLAYLETALNMFKCLFFY
jgi:hypothetical protein